jgi:hypothetical protein
MTAELFRFSEVLAVVLNTRIIVTSTMDNRGVLILVSYLERKVMTNETWPGLALTGTAKSNSISA